MRADRAAGLGVAQRAAADGRAVEQVRGDELRRHRRDDGAVAAGDQVAVVAGPREPPPGAGALLRARNVAEHGPTATLRTNRSPCCAEELVAYLDGELDAGTAGGSRSGWPDEPETRRTLQELERTWNLLDELERRRWTRISRGRRWRWWPWRRTRMPRRPKPAARPQRRWLAAGGGLLAAALAGALAVALLGPTPMPSCSGTCRSWKTSISTGRSTASSSCGCSAREKLFTEDADEGP